ncbi:MAG: DUF4870 domain-containing protein [Acidobacteriota bacterium]
MGDAEPPVGSKPYADEDKIHLFLAYFFLLALIPFFMFKDKQADPQKEYVYWHGRQGLAFAAVAIVASIIGFFGSIMISVLTLGIGGILHPCIMCVLFVLFLAVNIVAWVKAFEGEKWEIPLVHKIAEMFG